jgi:hypothetical protein
VSPREALEQLVGPDLVAQLGPDLVLMLGELLVSTPAARWAVIVWSDRRQVALGAFRTEEAAASVAARVRKVTRASAMVVELLEVQRALGPGAARRPPWRP